MVGAENGTLTFMVGGDKSALAEAERLLGSMGSRWVHCGPAGSGLVAKICNNMILGMTMVAVAEAMNLGVKYDVMYTHIIRVQYNRIKLKIKTLYLWTNETVHPYGKRLEREMKKCSIYMCNEKQFADNNEIFERKIERKVTEVKLNL